MQEYYQYEPKPDYTAKFIKPSLEDMVAGIKRVNNGFIIEYFNGEKITEVVIEQRENRIPEIVKECSVTDWDTYNAEPVSKVVIERAIEILKRLEELKIDCPRVYAVPDGDIEMEWNWYKGNWTISVKNQERFAWDIYLCVSEKIIDDKGDCMFFDHDARNGISKNDPKFFSIYFNYQDEVFPEKMIERLNEMKLWKENDTRRTF